MTSKILPLLLTIAVGFAGCDQASCQAVSEAAKPTLDAVLARADVPRLLECAALPTPKDAATCLGAEALTQGLEVALERATNLAEQARDASNPSAGAADMDDGQREVLAGELDAALDDLAREVAAANAV